MDIKLNVCPTIMQKWVYSGLWKIVPNDWLNSRPSLVCCLFGIKLSVCPVIVQNIHSTTRMLSVMVKEVLCNVVESLYLLNIGAKRVSNPVLYNCSRHPWTCFLAHERASSLPVVMALPGTHTLSIHVSLQSVWCNKF